MPSSARKASSERSGILSCRHNQLASATARGKHWIWSLSRAIRTSRQSPAALRSRRIGLSIDGGRFVRGPAHSRPGQYPGARGELISDVRPVEDNRSGSRYADLEATVAPPVRTCSSMSAYRACRLNDAVRSSALRPPRRCVAAPSARRSLTGSGRGWGRRLRRTADRPGAWTARVAMAAGRPSPSRPCRLHGGDRLPMLDQDRLATLIQVGLCQRQSLVDAQPARQSTTIRPLSRWP
jgi:hypothetical protein